MAWCEGRGTAGNGAMDVEILQDPLRLAALRRLALLETPADAAFNRLTRLTCAMLRVPIALVTLVAGDYQFFKSAKGLPEPWQSRRGTPLSHSFCQYTVAGNAPLVIEDARAHPLVSDNAAIYDLSRSATDSGRDSGR